jgi:hypothetical protein
VTVGSVPPKLAYPQLPYPQLANRSLTVRRNASGHGAVVAYDAEYQPDEPMRMAR